MRAGLAALLLASGCTLALDYPASAELCGNGVDDDLDGLTDCDDLCTGICAEDHAGKCTNDHDDDGDGLTDWDDPGCWPLADVTLSSCASVPGTDAMLDFDGDDERWAATTGTLIADPTTTHPGVSFVLTDPIETADAQEIHDLVGAVAGTRLVASVHLDPSVDRVYVELRVEDPPLDVARIGVAIDAGVVLLEAESTDSVELADVGAAWYELEIALVSATAIRVTLTRAGVVAATLTTNVPAASWAVAHALSLRLDARRASAAVVVGDIHVTREPYEPCDRVMPDAAAATFQPHGLAMLDDGTVCAAGLSFVSASGAVASPWPPALSRTRDRGFTWTTRVHDELALDGFGPLTSYFVGGEVREGRLHTLLFEQTIPSRLASTDDCAEVTLDGSVPSGADRDVRGYAFDGTTHEILAMNASQLVARRFAAGDTTYQTTPIVSFASASDVGDVVRRGNDYLVAVRGLDGHLGVVSTLATAPGVRRLVSIEGSGLWGACDEHDTRDPVFAIDATPRIADAVATGLVIVECVGRDGFQRGPAGFVTDLWTIRAPVSNR